LKTEWNSDWRVQGVRCIAPPEGLFSNADIEILHQLSDKLPYEWVELGDADEANRLEVGRFMTDVEQPLLVNKPLSSRALEVVKRPQYMEIYRALLDCRDLYVRRMQVNRIHQDGFVGYHLDIDSNPDYEVAVIIQLGRDFSGGEFVVYSDGEARTSIAPPHYSVILSDCRFPHEVKAVTGGIRTSLVFFLSEHDGNNRRKR
jgi:hypothetical protein